MHFDKFPSDHGIYLAHRFIFGNSRNRHGSLGIKFQPWGFGMKNWGDYKHLYNSENLDSLLLAFLHKGKSEFLQDDILDACSPGSARYWAVLSVRMAATNSQTKHRQGFLTKCSKLPLTCFVDRRKKGINLILDRDSDEGLENVFWTWGVSTLRDMFRRHLLSWRSIRADGAAHSWHSMVLGSLGSQQNRDELVFSSSMSPKRMWLCWPCCAL